MKQKKLKLEKFTVAKLTNMSKIFGGVDETEGDTVLTLNNTTRPTTEMTKKITVTE